MEAPSRLQEELALKSWKELVGLEEPLIACRCRPRVLSAALNGSCVMSNASPMISHAHNDEQD